jgi:glycosyltransferase involved in cell wall biosynthesis
MGRRPRLSIGMPVYNAERFLECGLRSILNQTFSEFELILSDNASTDRTLQICEDFASLDSRIRLYQSEYNRGGGWNHNRVLELATGQYFKWATYDDLCHANMVEECVAALEQDTQAVLAHSRTTVIDEHGDAIENYLLELRTDSPDPATRFRDLVMSYHQCYQIYGVIRRSALERTGPMGNFVHGDGILLANLALYGPFHKVPEYLFFSRRHAAQSSRTVPSRLRGQRIRLTRRVNGMPCTEWWDPARQRTLTFPQWRQLAEYVGVVNRAPLDFRNRIRCHAVNARWVVRDRRRYVKDLLIAADQLLDNMFAPSDQSTQERGGAL